MKHDVIIRQAEENDWKILQKLNQEVFDDNSKYDRFIIRDWPITQFGISYYKEVTRNKAYITLIAEINDKPVGYLISTKHIRTYRKLNIIEIDNIGVSPRFRSKGIGKALVTYFMQWAIEHGFNAIFVNTYYKNNRAIKFYQSLGMKPIDMSLEMKI